MENLNNESLNIDNQEDIYQSGKKNVSAVVEEVKQGFKKLKKGTKIAITVTAAGILLSIFFTLGNGMTDRYNVLFSDLSSIDANTITQILEDQGIDMKVEGSSIYVKSDKVDELRLKLSSNITNGSVGFEIMDQSSGLGMTEEEFQIKKQRMIQGEIERTIKSFPQVSNVRVHITPGEESVFAKESKAGSAAVYLELKAGQQLKQSQVMSIVSLVSASSTNIPKQNVEVMDQNMTLLSEDMFDEDGNYVENSTKTSGLDSARAAEKAFNEDLEKSLMKLLTPLFGEGKVKLTVNADLNFDSVEKTELKFDPNNVIKTETISENSTSDKTQSGSPVDNNMSNTAQTNGESSTSKDVSREYEVGKTETTTIVAPGEIQRVTASVAIDGNVDTQTREQVQELIETAIGLNANRGDKVTVMSTSFDTSVAEQREQEAAEARKKELIKKATTIGGGVAGVVALALVALAIRKKKNKERQFFDGEFDERDDELLMAEDIINQTLAAENANMGGKADEVDSEDSFLDGNVNTHKLEEEIRRFASENPEQTTELIKIWLNE